MAARQPAGADRHRRKPVSVRLPGDLEDWLTARARADRMPLRRLMTEALMVYMIMRDRGGADLAEVLAEARRRLP